MRTNALPQVTASTFWGHGLGIRQRANGMINLADDMQVDVDMTFGHLRALKWFLPELWKQREKFSFHLNGAMLRDLRGQAVLQGHDLPRLSMGMSGDFPLAIAEGASEVRIGTAIFGSRGYPDSHYWPETAGQS